MKFTQKDIVHCFVTLVNMNGGFVVIPENERKLVEYRDVKMHFNENTGTVTIQIESEEEDRFEESGDDYV